MADQAVAQTGALRAAAGQPYNLGYKLAWRWKAVCSWAYYAVAGRHKGLPGLVDLLLVKNFIEAIQVRSELSALGEVLTDLRPERALEIGTAQGGTLFFLTRLASPRATIVSVDLPRGKFGGGYGKMRELVYRTFARFRQRLHLLRGDSHSEKMFRLVKKTFKNRPLDYLFIDGDHTYDGVKKDFEMYAPLVRKGGLIVFHDIVEGPSNLVGGVPQFWREISSRYPFREVIGDPLQGGYGIGIIFFDGASFRS